MSATSEDAPVAAEIDTDPPEPNLGPYESTESTYQQFNPSQNEEDTHIENTEGGEGGSDQAEPDPSNEQLEDCNEAEPIAEEDTDRVFETSDAEDLVDSEPPGKPLLPNEAVICEDQEGQEPNEMGLSSVEAELDFDGHLGDPDIIPEDMGASSSGTPSSQTPSTQEIEQERGIEQQEGGSATPSSQTPSTQEIEHEWDIGQQQSESAPTISETPPTQEIEQEREIEQHEGEGAPIFSESAPTQEIEQNREIEKRESVPSIGAEAIDVEVAVELGDGGGDQERASIEAQDRSDSLGSQTDVVVIPRAGPPAVRVASPRIPAGVDDSRENSFADSPSQPLLPGHHAPALSETDMRRHVALSIPTNKVSAAYVRAQSRMNAIQEQEKKLFMKKSCWNDVRLGYRRLKAWLDGISLWTNRIQVVEGKHGSNVALILYFLRWTLLLNVAIMALWLVAAILPFMRHPPDTFSWSLFSEHGPKQMLQGYGVEKTWFLYGGYDYPTGAIFGGYFQPEIAFPLAICFMYLLSFVALLNVMAQRFSGQGDASAIEQNETYPFSSVIFAAWDFHLRDLSASRNLKNGIRNQIKEMLHDASWKQQTVTWQMQILNGATKMVGTLIFWPVTVVLTAAAMYFIIEKGDAINNYFGFAFAQTTCITLVTIVSQFLVRSTVKYEGWHPRVAQQVEAMKLFSVKAINLAIIVYQLYNIQETAVKATSSLESADSNDALSKLKTCSWSDLSQFNCDGGFTCCDPQCAADRGDAAMEGHCVPVCEENVMGLIFYRLMISNGIIISFQEVGMALFMSIVLRMPPEMDAAKFFVNIIETQALVWLGTMTAPVMPLFGVLSNMTTFYVKTWLALHIFNPPQTTCSASRNSNMQYTLMLVTLILCSLPMSTTFSVKRDVCGPHKGHSMAWAITNKIKNAPSWVQAVLGWITNPLLLGGVIMLMAFYLMFQRAQRSRWQNQAKQQKREFSKYRHDMQLKMAESRRSTPASSAAATPKASFTTAKSGKSQLAQMSSHPRSK